jgi:hypothetical protein
MFPSGCFLLPKFCLIFKSDRPNGQIMHRQAAGFILKALKPEAENGNFNHGVVKS